MSIKKHKIMNSGIFYGCVLGILGIVLSVAFKSSLYMIFGIGIGSAIDLVKYSCKSKRNK